MISEKQLRIIVILAAILVVLVFAPILFTFNIIGTVTGDIFAYYYPLRFQAAASLQAGHISLWNPYIFSGVPFQANMQTALFYPMNILFYLFSLRSAFSFFYVLHYFLAFIGMYLLAGEWLKNQYAASLSAIVSVFAGFFLVKIAQGHMTIHAGYSLIPYIILFVRRQMTCSNNYHYAVIWSLALVLQFLSGHIQPFYMTMLFTGLYILGRWKSVRLPVVLAGGIVLCATAVQLFPTIQYAFLSSRTLWHYGTAVSYSLSFKSFITMLFPGWFGNPLSNTFAVSAYPSKYFEMYTMYLGIIPMVLSIIGLGYELQRKRFGFFLYIAFFSVLALGDNTLLYPFLYAYLPGLSWLRAPARFYAIIIFLISLLAGRGMVCMMRIKIFRPFPLLLCGTSFLMLFLPYRKYVFNVNPAHYITRTKTAEFAAFFAAKHRICTAEDIPNPNHSMMYHLYNINGYEAMFLKTYALYIDTCRERHALTTTGITVRDHTSPLLKALALKLLVTGNGHKDVEPVFKNNNVALYQNRDIPARIFAARNEVRRSSEYGIGAYMTGPSYVPYKDVVFLGKTLNTTPVAQNASLAWHDVSENKIIIRTNSNSPLWVVCSDAYYPGWEAYAEGTALTVYRCNYFVKGLWMDKTGEKDVYLLFRPRVYRIGLLATVLTMTTLLIVYIKFIIIN